MVDPVCWFQLTRSQKEINELPGLAEDKETEKKGYNKFTSKAKVILLLLSKFLLVYGIVKFQVSLLRTTNLAKSGERIL